MILPLDRHAVFARPLVRAPILGLVTVRNPRGLDPFGRQVILSCAARSRSGQSGRTRLPRNSIRSSAIATNPRPPNVAAQLHWLPTLPAISDQRPSSRDHTWDASNIHDHRDPCPRAQHTPRIYEHTDTGKEPAQYRQNRTSLPSNDIPQWDAIVENYDQGTQGAEHKCHDSHLGKYCRCPSDNPLGLPSDPPGLAPLPQCCPGRSSFEAGLCTLDPDAMAR
jgi:hypothetical protein